jgi:hypothetical protein
MIDGGTAAIALPISLRVSRLAENPTISEETLSDSPQNHPRSSDVSLEQESSSAQKLLNQLTVLLVELTRIERAIS